MKRGNITLIGMPGAGKSTVGVVLAKTMGKRFLDSDLLIQEKEGKRLHEIISEVGREGFLEVEDRINAEIDCKNAVIATGGSVVYCENAMRHLKEISTVVYLMLDYESLAHRLGDLNKRGVVLNDGQTLKDLYLERVPLYEKYADITVDADKGTVTAVIREIEAEFSEKKESVLKKAEG